MRAARAHGTVALDLRAAQSRIYRERGIARYALNLVAALVEHHPELVGSVIVDPDRPPAADLDRVLPSGRVRTPGTWPAEERIFHAMSPFDLEVPVSELWPRAASRAGMRLILTVYDLIPHLFPKTYLVDPAARAAYRARHHLVRAADHIVTLSASAATDLMEQLGIDESRITVIGAAAEPRFQRPASRGRAASQAVEAVEGLEPGYIVYNGGVEPRKNMEALVEAYAALPSEVKEHRQLVLVCRMDEDSQAGYQRMARELGIEGQLVLTGYVPDELLVLLNQGADLVAFPSLYEGYGLPVVEAIACGAPVIASGTSSLPELVAPEACFDPRDIPQLTALMQRALTDPALRARLLEWSSQPQPDWRQVAVRTAEVYRRCAESSRFRPARRLRLAVMPASGRGEERAEDLELVDALAEHAIVDILQDGVQPSATSPGSQPDADWEPPPGSAIVAADTLARAQALRGGYDAIVVTVCDGRSGISALRFLRAHRASAPVVIAHDVQLVELYHSAARAGVLPGGFVGAALSMYRWLSAEQLAEPSPRAAAERLGLPMAREVIGLSGMFLALSAVAADLARTDSSPEHAGRIGVLAAAEVGARAEQLLELLSADRPGRATGPRS